jgi:uncharacterized protein (TIGR03437 family)
VKHTLLTVCFILTGGAMLQAQPTITSVTNESGSANLCPGGIAFVKGTGLGNTSTKVTVGTKQAYVFNGSGAQLQVELPVDAPLGATTLTAGASAPFNITLVQYCPGIGINNGVAGAFHYPSGTPVTASFPAAPNEQIALVATGLGPTNPVVPTGQSPSDNSAVVVTLPTVSEGGKPATVSTAFLSPNNAPGFYAVIFTVRSDATTGNVNITVSIGGLTSNQGPLPISTGPIIGSVTNAGSYIDPSLPNGPIAQGSIFVVKGINMGPGTISIAANAFQSTSVGGTSLSITISGTTVAALMYYSSAGQVAALLPSNTPVGTGTITGTYNGQTGPAAQITVVANNLGIFTVTSDGQGAGIVTFADYSLVSTVKAANCGGVYTTCGAANPGDVLIIWATGLGPITGSDAKGDGLGVNMTSLPLTVWLGGVKISAAYQGRSGCCVGEDQIVFTVPPNVPTGCAVPLAVQIGNFISNSVAMPVAATGSRTCTPVDPAFTTDFVAQTASSNPISFGDVDLRRNDNYPGLQDIVKTQFLRFTVPAAVQPFFFSYIDVPSLGSCQIFNNNNSSPPFSTFATIDAGPQLTVQGPNGSKNVSSNGKTTVSATGNFFGPGTFTVSGPGGADVPAFSTSVTIPALPTMTSPPPDPANPFSVTKSNGLTVTWSGGSANTYIEMDGFSYIDNTFTTGANFQCVVSSAAGSFTIPPTVLLAMPAGNFAGLDFYPTGLPITLTAKGLTASQLTFRFDNFTPLVFK